MNPQPDDEYNQALLRHVRPAGWVNPRPQGRYNLVVVGGGTAGLVAAMGAAGLGAKVALVERHMLGGDCLNFGCVPSKALIRAGRAAYDAQQLGEYGGAASAVTVDFGAVMARMRRLRAGISHHDSAQRFAEAGIDVYLGHGEFVSPTELVVDGERLRFARALVATGARAVVPAIVGLAEAGFVTNETVFSLTTLPRRLAVIGAGPIGCELAQAFRRFGSEVTMIAKDTEVLPREDADARAVLQAQLVAEGITLALGADVVRVEVGSAGKVLYLAGDATVTVDEILVAVGRAPNVESMGLAAAGIAVDRTGVVVDDRLRTANHKIFAAGDVCSPFKFTHAADAMARIVIQNALFFGRKRTSALTIPWATYTDPEVAHVGLYQAQAQARGYQVATFTVQLSGLDRAILDGDTAGFARIVVNSKNGKLLGATAVGRHAGELIGEATLALRQGLRASALSSTIHAYPTQSEVWKRLGDAQQRTRLTPRARSIFRWLLAKRR